jgi:hypothetical protein
MCVFDETVTVQSLQINRGRMTSRQDTWYAIHREDIMNVFKENLIKLFAKSVFPKVN